MKTENAAESGRSLRNLPSIDELTRSDAGRRIMPDAGPARLTEIAREVVPTCDRLSFELSQRRGFNIWDPSHGALGGTIKCRNDIRRDFQLIGPEACSGRNRSQLDGLYLRTGLILLIYQNNFPCHCKRVRLPQLQNSTLH